MLNHLLLSIPTAVEYESYLETCATVRGYLRPIEGFTLAQCAASGPGVGEIVEIGSCLGRSTSFLALGSKKARRERVTAIDHFQGSPEHQPGREHSLPEIVAEGSTFRAFRANLERLSLWDHVEPIVMSSSEAARSWTRPIRLLFIDGDHSYDATRRDFEAFEPFVIPGGLICFHDIGGWEGVTRFYQEILARRADLVAELTVGSLAVVSRKLP